jgi:tetratricopeptide (TPR) repeat protein
MNLPRLLLLSLALPFLLVAQSLDEGVLLMSKRKYAEARTVFESILKKDNKNAEAHYRLGQVFLSNQLLDADVAVDHMEEAVDLNPRSADYQYGLGAALGIKARDAGVIKQAFLAPRVKGAFEKAIQLNPNLVEAHAGLVEYYRRAPGIMGGDMAKAWSEADIVIGLDEFRGRPLKASLFLAEKRNAEAVQELKQLTSNRPKEWRAWRTAGMFFWRNKMTDEAAASFEKYTQLRPDTADSFVFLGRAYLLKKDADKAIALCTKALSLDDSYTPAFDVLAQAHEMKGQKKEALQAYERLLAADLSPDQKKNIQKKIKELQ